MGWENSNSSTSSTDRVLVGVRLRSLAAREVARGDRAAWGMDDEGRVGPVVVSPATHSVTSAGPAIAPKFVYDVAFQPTHTNQDVYDGLGARVVQAAAEGINGTLFAYGVTSSGKTHTIMGGPGDPGVVPLALQHLFAIVAATPDRRFELSLSMVEIYNEVVNDLLDPSRCNLAVREDAGRGTVIEGVSEAIIQTPEEAGHYIRAGNVQRQVSATAYNEGSSRSHTVCRVAVESEDPATGQRLLSYLNIIDLAGSESSRAALNKGGQREGAYINKSLLTLATVIKKLSEGGAAHIPFRDSKLTRLLHNSLAGAGAKIAIVCTITPAHTQSEETHNTLKFALRAKAIKVHAVKNEIVDDKSLIKRYELEIADLKAQLVAARVSGGACGSPGTSSAGQPDLELLEEVHTLRERVAEEHHALLAKSSEEEELRGRLARLSEVILCLGGSKSGMQGSPVANPRDLIQSVSASAAMELAVPGSSEAPGSSPVSHRPGGSPSGTDTSTSGRVDVTTGFDLRHPGWAASAGSLTTGGSLEPAGDGETGRPPDEAVAVQLAALTSRLRDAETAVTRVEADNAALRAARESDAERARVAEAALRDMEARARQAAQEAARKDALVGRFQELEVQVENLRRTSQDNAALRKQVARSQTLASRLQGYDLDEMKTEQLAALEQSLILAARRVAITAQMREVTGVDTLIQPAVPADEAV